MNRKTLLEFRAVDNPVHVRADIRAQSNKIEFSNNWKYE